MSWVLIVWSASAGACLLIALLYLLNWLQDRHGWEDLCFSITVLGVLGIVVCEMVTMHADSPDVYGRALRCAHAVYAIGVLGCVGFVHFYFESDRTWLLITTVALRALALTANFATGANLDAKIVAAHDGKMGATKNTDGGATFHVVLPAIGGRTP